MTVFLIVCAVCVLTAVASLIFCLLRGPAPERKKLLCTLPIPIAGALLHFLSRDVLSLMGRNLLFGATLIAVVYRCMKILEQMVTENDSRSMVYFFSYVVLTLTLFLIPVCLFFLSLSL